MSALRPWVFAAALTLLPASAFARCECACVGGQMRPVCSPWDVVAPICQGLCGMTIPSERISTPLAGGGQILEPSPPAGTSPANAGGGAPFPR